MGAPHTRAVTRKSARVRRRLIAAGEALGLTPAEMSEKSGIPRSTMSKYILGTNNPMGVRRELMEELAAKWEREALGKKATAIPPVPRKETPPKGNGSGSYDLNIRPFKPLDEAKKDVDAQAMSLLLKGYRLGYRDGYDDGVKQRHRLMGRAD